MNDRNVDFVVLSEHEKKFRYMGESFILKEDKRGFYGAGRSVSLYGLDGFNKVHITSIGWTRCDGEYSKSASSRGGETDVLEGIVSWSQIEDAALDYLDKFLG